MVANKKAISALNRHKAELEEQNHNNIVQALVRIKNGTTDKLQLKRLGKITVKELALESGVSRASLYGNHKSLLDEFDKINKKRTIGVAERRKEREKKAENDKELIRELLQVKELLAQENYRLNEENKVIKRHVNALLAQLGNKSNVISINNDQD